MLKNKLLLILIFGIAYSQCDELIESQCIAESNCEWIDDVENGWCGSYNNNSSY